MQGWVTLVLDGVIRGVSSHLPDLPYDDVAEGDPVHVEVTYDPSLAFEGGVLNASLDPGQGMRVAIRGRDVASDPLHPSVELTAAAGVNDSMLITSHRNVSGTGLAAHTVRLRMNGVPSDHLRPPPRISRSSGAQSSRCSARM